MPHKISSPCAVLSDQSPFYKRLDAPDNRDIYRLDCSKLDSTLCHMFFPQQPCEELLIATSLEFFTFPPSNPDLNKKFNFAIVKLNDVFLHWCSFPKEFKEVCERASKTFKMTMSAMPRVMLSAGGRREQVEIQFPEAENVLCFQGERCYDPKQILERFEEIVSTAKTLENSGLD